MGLTPNDSKAGRSYTWDNDVFASVTTILGVLNKPALTGWASKMAAEFAVKEHNVIADLISRNQSKAAIDMIKAAPWRNRDAAADVGTLVHQMIENIHTGNEVTIPPEALQQVTHFLTWVDHFKPEILVSEGTIFNREYNYAGTLDLVAKIDGLNWLIDVKSGKGVYPEYAMQVAAYARGEFIGHEDGTEQVMPIIDKGAILHLRPGGYAFVPVHIGKEVFDSFLYCRELFRWQDDISHRALLPEVRK